MDHNGVMYAQNILSANLAAMPPEEDTPQQSWWEFGYDGVEVGIWECRPGTIRGPTGDYDEVFVCLSGAATMTGNDGVRYDLSAGSVLFTPSGFTGRWDVTDTFRKVYCTVNR